MLSVCDADCTTSLAGTISRKGPMLVEILGNDRAALSGLTGRWPQAFLGSFANTLGGGTSEVMRNIIGERCLGLPK